MEPAPLTDGGRADSPSNPSLMNWHAHYPSLIPESGPAAARVEIADIGCGFGGLLVALAPKLPHTLMLGLEIRVQVAEYVAERIAALRLQEAAKPAPEDRVPGAFANVSVLRANAMKFLPNLFVKGQVCDPPPTAAAVAWISGF